MGAPENTQDLMITLPSISEFFVQCVAVIAPPIPVIIKKKGYSADLAINCTICAISWFMGQYCWALAVLHSWYINDRPHILTHITLDLSYEDIFGEPRPKPQFRPPPPKTRTYWEPPDDSYSRDDYDYYGPKQQPYRNPFRDEEPELKRPKPTWYPNGPHMPFYFEGWEEFAQTTPKGTTSTPPQRNTRKPKPKRQRGKKTR